MEVLLEVLLEAHWQLALLEEEEEESHPWSQATLGALVCCCRLLRCHPHRHMHRQSLKEDHLVPQERLVVGPLEAADDVEAAEVADVAEGQVRAVVPYWMVGRVT